MEAQGLCSHLFSPLIDIVIVMTVSISGLKQLHHIAVVQVKDGYFLGLFLLLNVSWLFHVISVSLLCDW